MAGRPTGPVPPTPPANENASGAVGLDELRDPVDFSPLSPPADQASTAVEEAGVDLVELLPDFFFEIA